MNRARVVMAVAAILAMNAVSFGLTGRRGARVRCSGCLRR